MGCCTLVDPLQCSRAAGHTLSHSALPSPLLSACTLYSVHCTLPSALSTHSTAPRWVHFWWDDSNGLVAHSAEGQKRPQAAACTMGRAITHCTLLHTAHVGHCTHYTLVCTVHVAFQTTLKAQMAHHTVHKLHTNLCAAHNMVHLNYQHTSRHT